MHVSSNYISPANAHLHLHHHINQQTNKCPHRFSQSSHSSAKTGLKKRDQPTPFPQSNSNTRPSQAGYLSRAGRLEVSSRAKP